VQPRTIASLISSFLYERSFGSYSAEAFIAGLDGKTGEPFIAVSDLMGCMKELEDFRVAKAYSEQLYSV
jgi:20S proteasome subunit beta 3